MNWTISKAGPVIILVPFIFQAVFLLILWLVLDSAVTELGVENRIRRADNLVHSTADLMHAAEQDVAMFVASGDRKYLARYQSSKPELEKQLQSIATGLADDPSQLPALRESSRESSLFIESLDRLARRSSGQAVSATELDETSQRVKHFVGLLVHPPGSELDANVLRREEKLKVFVLLGLILTLSLSLWLGLFFTGGITGRLSVINDNAVRLSKREPLNPHVEGNDEISQLDSVFHKMADVLEQATRKEHAMIENAKDVIATLDKDGKFLTANPAACVLFGYDPSRLVGRPLTDLLLSDDVAETETALRRLPELFRQSIEHRLRTRDGNLLDIRWSMQWDEHEETVFCIGHDISERKQFERLKQDIVNMVSHDLRSPLTAIKMTVELLLMGALGPLTEKATDRLGTVDRDVDRLIRLVQELLEYEKIQAGKLELHCQWTNIAKMVEYAVEVTAPLAAPSSIKIQSAIADTSVYADRDRLTQVLINLISNAVKFSPDGSTIKLATTVADATVEFRVTNSGAPIPEEAQKSIFQPYHQCGSAESNRRGTGLGLTLSKMIVEAHHGDIGFTSDGQSGTAFWFRLPAKDEQRESIGKGELASL